MHGVTAATATQPASTASPHSRIVAHLQQHFPDMEGACLCTVYGFHGRVVLVADGFEKIGEHDAIVATR